MVNGDIPPRVKKDAHAMILEFIRSRPPLKKVCVCVYLVSPSLLTFPLYYIYYIPLYSLSLGLWTSVGSAFKVHTHAPGTAHGVYTQGQGTEANNATRNTHPQRKK